ncbi:MAG: GlsB/YeaQ/YmgE family stress response membrane protein [Trueperaceae bacterium]
MSWIIAILVGALVGWLASIIMKTDSQQGPIANILIGVVGAALARWFFADVLGVGGTAAGTFSIMGIVWGIIGAIVLIFLLKALRVLR